MILLLSTFKLLLLPEMFKANFKQQNESGSILLYTVLILNIILAISITLAGIFLPKIKVISQSGPDSIKAFYAADSAIEWCLYINKGKPPVNAPTMVNSSSYILIPSDCTIKPLNHRAIGTYRTVSRALQVEEK